MFAVVDFCNLFFVVVFFCFVLGFCRCHFFLFSLIFTSFNQKEFKTTLYGTKRIFVSPLFQSMVTLIISNC